MSTRTKGFRESSRPRASRGRARLSIRYFDDRVLLTDTHASASRSSGVVNSYETEGIR